VTLSVRWLMLPGVPGRPLAGLGVARRSAVSNAFEIGGILESALQ
jgi:hypothetical protein